MYKRLGDFIRWKQYISSLASYFVVIGFVFFSIIFLIAMTLGFYLCPENSSNCSQDKITSNFILLYSGMAISSFLGGMLAYWLTNKLFGEIDLDFGMRNTVLLFGLFLVISFISSAFSLQSGVFLPLLFFQTLSSVFMSLLMGMTYIGGYSTMHYSLLHQ